MSIAMQETIAQPEAGFAPGVYRLSVAQYFEMADKGILTTDDRVELIEGVLVAKMTKYPPHVLGTLLVFQELSRILPAGWHARQEAPVLTQSSVPEPDCAIIRGGARDYRDHHPSLEDVALVVEVADSSLNFDRKSKAKVYAKAAIPTYWIANLADHVIEVYSDPSGPSELPQYRATQIFTIDEVIPVVLDGHEIARIAVRDLLP